MIIGPVVTMVTALITAISALVMAYVALKSMKKRNGSLNGAP